MNYFDPYGLEALSYNKIKELVNNNNYSGLSNELIICLIYKESTFDPNEKNKKSSATGLMQVTTGAASDAGYKGKNMYDPITNVQAGSTYLKLRVKWAHGNVKSGLNGYGTGTGYANDILDCEKCLKENPCKADDCLEKVKR
ncbi:MAG: lytic transglycosylase domain-containing protein [Parabacteroides sp.]|nr:lytic transglycosylase domain-containing protein [Parabacteroides sp.]